MEARLWKLSGVYQEMKVKFGGYWIWLLSEEKRSYAITGKYLFFSEDKDKLIGIATNEIENHGFHKAKVNMNLIEGQNEHVLCLYYKDDSRKHELAERNKQEYGVKYRYWKSDEATLKGQYSNEFLSKLPESKRRRFTSEKEIIEFRDEKGQVILRQLRLRGKRNRKSKPKTQPSERA
jgi:alpha-amylase/alpha-mannosidase (GH57 family)